MDPDDPFQVWSFCDGLIVRIVASDFTICLHDENEPECVGTFDNLTEKRMPGDIRGHYAKAGEAPNAFWKRIT